VLDIQTDDFFTRPGENFFVGRYSRDILKRSRVGAVFINKDSVGGAHFNRTMGVDANLAPSANMQIQSYIAKTETPGKAGNDMAMFGRIAYRDPNWNLYLNYLDVQENFNAEAGFVQRTGIRTTKGHFSPTPRPTKGNVKLFEPMYVLTYTDRSGQSPDLPPASRHARHRRCATTRSSTCSTRTRSTCSTCRSASVPTSRSRSARTR
jgi:hypothetical protein